MVNSTICCDLMLATLRWEFQIFVVGHLLMYCTKSWYLCWIQSEWTMHGQTYTTITAKVYKLRPFELLFPSYGFLMIKENVYSVQLECPCSWYATCISLFVTVTATSNAARSRCVTNLHQFVCSVSSVKLVLCPSTLSAEMVDMCVTFGWI